MQKIKIKILIIFFVALLCAPIFAVTPTCGVDLSVDGAYLTTDETGGIGYGYSSNVFCGAEINRWSCFFGEIGFGIAKTEYDFNNFSRVKPPVDFSFGGGWIFSPGAGLSLSLSGGLALSQIGGHLTTWTSGLYGRIVPKWVIIPFPDMDYYVFTLSFPVQVSYTTGETLHVKGGLSLGVTVSIYGDRRGNSFTEPSY